MRVLRVVDVVAARSSACGPRFLSWVLEAHPFAWGAARKAWAKCGVETRDPEALTALDAAATVGTATAARPHGALLCRFATVNDVHFGETECGRIDDNPQGPIQRAMPGDEPYPEVMNRGAVAEMAAINPAAVIVKGDLSLDGQQSEWNAFEACYRTAFGERLHVVRGNHDSYHGQTTYAGDHWIELPGVNVALLDTCIPTETTGRITAENHIVRANSLVEESVMNR